jgi:hypothetical protein
METLRAFLYSLAIFAALAVLALLVAVIMKLIYSLVHRSEKKKDGGAVAQSIDATPGKVG